MTIILKRTDDMHVIYILIIVANDAYMLPGTWCMHIHILYIYTCYILYDDS